METVSFKQMIRDGDARRADIRKVRLDDIHEEPGFNLRIESPDLQSSIEALAEYIYAGGLYPPLEARPRPGGGVWVVDGHRRRRALLLARERGAPIEWICVIPFEGNDVDRTARIISSAEGRALSPLESSLGYKRLAAFGLSPDEIAGTVFKTKQHVEQLLILANANRDVQQMVASGDVSAALAVTVLRKHGEDAGRVLQAELDKAKAVGKGKITAGTMKPWTPPPKIVAPLVGAADAVVASIDTAAYKTLNEYRDALQRYPRQKQKMWVTVEAGPMLALLEAQADMNVQRGKATDKAREKAARAKQLDIEASAGEEA